MKYEVILKSGATLVVTADKIEFPTSSELLPVLGEGGKPDEKYRIVTAEVAAIAESDRKETRASLYSGRD